MSKQYHPDLNQGDKESEDKFKEVAEAYDVLGSEAKRSSYDSKRNNRRRRSRHTSFEEWANTFGSDDFRSGSGFNRSRRRSKSPNQSYVKPDTSHLNILDTITIDLIESINGKQVTLSYKKQSVVDFQSGSREVVDKTLKVTINLRDKHINIIKRENGDYYIKVKLSGFGNEDIIRRLNVWGETESEVIIGDYILNVNLKIPEEIDIEDNNIIQYVDVPLHKTLFPEEKVRVRTIFDKTYDAEISNPSKLNDLKFKIGKHGIRSKYGTIGDYIIRFNIIPPDMSKLKSKDIEVLKQYLTDDLYQ